jgi:hypothetical protein
VEGAEGGHAVSLLANESTRSAGGSGLERKRNLEHSDPNEVRGPSKKNKKKGKKLWKLWKLKD